MRNRNSSSRLTTAAHAAVISARPAIEGLEDRRLFAAGAPDPTFSGDGLATVAPAGGFEVIDVEVRGGRTVALGSSFEAAAGGVVAGGANLVAYTSSGAIDKSFSSDGIRPLPKVVDPVALAVQPDGKILVAGDIDGVSGIARLLPNGAADTSFAGTGFKVMPTARYISDMKLAPNGKIVIAAQIDADGVNGADSDLLRLNANGSPDTSFSGDGIASVDYGATSVAIQADGKVVVVSFVEVSNSQRDLIATRLTAAGAVDTSYGEGGQTRYALTGDSYVQFANVAPDGRVVVGKRDGENDLGVLRLNTAGRVDLEASYVMSFSLNASLRDVLASPDGKIYLVGSATQGYGPDSGTRIARLDADGTSDNTFGIAGTLELGDRGAATLASDGKLVTAGNHFEVDQAAPNDSVLSVRRFIAATADAERVGLIDGVLHVEGTNAKDTITVTTAGGNVQVKLNAISRTFAKSSVVSIDVGGNGGNDVIKTTGFGGRVVAHGGSGDDTINTGAGVDTIYGDDGNDTVNAGGGDDYVYGGAGNDLVNGGDGLDHVLGDGIDGQLDGDRGADRVYGGAGNDYLSGNGIAAMTDRDGGPLDPAVYDAFADYLDGGVGTDDGFLYGNKDATYSVELFGDQPT